MDLTSVRPKYITFDCYGTLTSFDLNLTVKPLVADRISEEDMPLFLKDYRAYRMDEVLGEFKLYPDVLKDSFRRACERWGIGYRPSDGEAIVACVPTWGPHADVPAALAKLADTYPLVILSNAVDETLRHNVDKLDAPFHKVFTAEQARAYKPRYQAFEYLLDQLGCERDEIVHVSSHIWYDLIPAHELRIPHKVYVNRGYDPSTPFYQYAETADLSGVPAVLGL
ncbi:haloacid dehalogenase type II [Nonomuraea sp. NPDC050643]|uniref:haloacid dehalogenase type II n=1 Tax=Nonomuraea sp. NPDC050643 TaxID=3155660 RepID=UPI0034021825